MPYKSRAQLIYLHLHEPKVAARWDKEYTKGTKLPYHVKKRRKKKPHGHR